ncbi:plasmid partitioning protein [Streptomyces sp. DH-12]|uniref:ParB/RepB/Spo0J family partition protein n=1 Tax=unclassified Streptomyces TaxID=2593676 RepID=UPI000CCF80DB|nr:ParB/RepB/Spo0J family partition protein [Streptomyces sp. DH-12]PNV30961.1 plasmid partitioning protein [Streptomyces sp. DH-12]
MSKADQLGAGRFGGGVRSVSARRQAVAAATGVPTEGVAPPAELPVHRISLNPDNPRSALGDLTDLAGSLKTHGQKQAITVMNRDAYVKANPDREADLEPDTTHVVIDGSSRLAAAREAALPTIKVMVSDDQGTTSEELLESALVANIHRQDLQELDEARALQRLLAIHGSQRALAKRLHRSQGWVSQRLALLNLTPELQARIGEEPIDLLRAVGNKPADQQEAALRELKAEKARKEEKSRIPSNTGTQPTTGTAASPEDDHDGDYDVITDPVSDTAPREHEAAEPATAPEEPAVAGHRTAPEPAAVEHEPPATETGKDTPSVPVQATATTTAVDMGEQPKRFPYEDGVYAAQHLIHKMPPEEFDKMLDLLIKHRDSRTVRTG